MPDYRRSPGFTFLQETKLSPQVILERDKEIITPAPGFKEYPEARRFTLPKPPFPPDDLWKALTQRRSIRRYQKTPLSLEDLSLLVFATQGITARSGSFLLRTAPSAGALYPIETYLCVNRVSGLTPGLYHLEVRSFSLEELVTGSVGEELAKACLGQKMCATASVVFIWSATPRRTMSKYGSRGVRYLFMDVAHICENLLLAASSIGLGACPIGAFFDDEVNDLLGLDGEEELALYLASVGHPVK